MRASRWFGVGSRSGGSFSFCSDSRGAPPLHPQPLPPPTRFAALSRRKGLEAKPLPHASRIRRFVHVVWMSRSGAERRAERAARAWLWAGPAVLFRFALIGAGPRPSIPQPLPPPTHLIAAEPRVRQEEGAFPFALDLRRAAHFRFSSLRRETPPLHPQPLPPPRPLRCAQLEEGAFWVWGFVVGFWMRRGSGPYSFLIAVLATDVATIIFTDRGDLSVLS